MPGVLLAVLAGFSILFVRLYQLQVIEGREYARLSENNCIRVQRVVPARGLILDRNGTVLADNRPSFDVVLTPHDARPVARVLPLIAQYLDIPLDTWGPRLLKAEKEAPYTPIVLKSDVDRDRLAVVAANALRLPGVTIATRSQRYFPFGPTFAHLLGYVAEVTEDELKDSANSGKELGDVVGKTGVERLFEPQLAGGRGGRQVEVDARGRVVSVMRMVPAAPGDNLVLTVDARLQEKARLLMAGETGAVAALDPYSGRVLALYSSPSFDPNLFVSGMSRKDWTSLSRNPQRPLQNRALAGVYPPGSTYKIVTLMAALSEGVVTPESTLYCPGFYSYGNRDFWCWRRGGHGAVDAQEALTQSCDVYCYKAGEMLGVDRLAYYARASGLGAVTGLGMEGEARGLVPTMAWKKTRTGRPWAKGETLSVAIGQGYNLVTPLQMAVLTAAVANGGIRYRPQVVERVERPDHTVSRRFSREPAGRLPISPAFLDVIRRGLWGVMNSPNGTAFTTRTARYEIYGKTGTAQVVGRRGQDRFLNQTSSLKEFQDHAWFVAYCTPEGLPGIAVAVLVEHGGHGGVTAAPVARDLILEYLRLSQPQAGQAAGEAAGMTATAGASGEGASPVTAAGEAFPATAAASPAGTTAAPGQGGRP